jgi:threonine dehydrogenase-like Zn-dependent dehydrogenase
MPFNVACGRCLNCEEGRTAFCTVVNPGFVSISSHYLVLGPDSRVNFVGRRVRVLRRFMLRDLIITIIAFLAHMGMSDSSLTENLN